MNEFIDVRGAREHNLKNLSLKIPRNKLVVITGLSGSGKSSLAFDTIYAEGQRRYIESLSPYVRQFLDKLKKPDVDHISGLSPSIAIEQKNFSHNPRSTVATLTEIYDFLRLFYAKLGRIYCYLCDRAIGARAAKDIVEDLLKRPAGTLMVIYAPLVRGRKGEFRKFLEEIQKKGYAKVRVDGTVYDLRKGFPQQKKSQRHDIEVWIDEFRLDPKARERLKSALEEAFGLAKGTCLVVCEEAGRQKPAEILFSEKRSCPDCGIAFEELTPNMFSFNSPYGACPKCKGLGQISRLMEDYIIANPKKPIFRGALNPEINFSFNKYVIEEIVHRLQEAFHVDPVRPFEQWPAEAREAFFWGSDEFSGLLDELRELYYQTSSEVVKQKVRKFLREDVCPECKGSRLQKKSLGVRLGDKNIVALSALNITAAAEFLSALAFNEQEKIIAAPILKEITARLHFLLNVGLSYLTLDRPAVTLTSGELQRIRLASQISVGLTGVLYVLDEPSVGLHPRDIDKLLSTLRRLRDLNNTVLVVEHDEATIRQADYIIDLGPTGGVGGGHLVGSGAADVFVREADTETARFLRGEAAIALPGKRTDYRARPALEVHGAEEHNLKKIDIRFPLGVFTCVTGVSGSGKSTLVHDILFKALQNKFYRTGYHVGKHKSISGLEHIDKVIQIDQTPIGRTPRSNPATYTDIFIHMRRLYSSLAESKLRNFSPARFSFNVKGGRCEACEGSGYKRLAMSFMPDVYVLCDVCNGMRYNEQTLEVRYKDRHIADVLNLSVVEAVQFFSSIPPILEKLVWLQKIGLGYIKLGQPSTTLSGGEAQRIKLATELSKRATGRTIYILDEPSTGLHFADIRLLVNALLELRDAGNTVIVIEHNLDIIKMADYLVDLGPEGGGGGGKLMAAGSPEEIVKVKSSYTGQYLAPHLNLPARIPAARR